MIAKAKRPRTQLILCALIGLAAVIFPSALNAQTDAGAPAQNKLEKLNAIGNATEATALTCTNVPCTSPDTCDFYTMTGTVSSFTSFGPAMVNPNIFICISEDTTNASSNGNDGTTCAPASGTVLLTGSTKKTVTMSLAGQVCTLPDTAPSTVVSVVSAAFAITRNSPLLKTVSRGSGSFSAFFNSVSGSASGNDATFTFNGNFSK